MTGRAAARCGRRLGSHCGSLSALVASASGVGAGIGDGDGLPGAPADGRADGLVSGVLGTHEERETTPTTTAAVIPTSRIRRRRPATIRIGRNPQRDGMIRDASYASARVGRRFVPPYPSPTSPAALLRGSAPRTLPCHRRRMTPVARSPARSRVSSRARAEPPIRGYQRAADYDAENAAGLDPRPTWLAGRIRSSVAMTT